MALTGLAIMAALGLVKNEMVDKPAADKKRKYEAATAAYAPWTGLKSEPVAEPNGIGQAIQYGSAGAAMGSNIAKDSAETNLMNSLSKNPSVSGADTAPSMDMSAKLGSQAKSFDTDMNSSLDKSMHPVTSKMDFAGPSAVKPDDSQSAWFFGNSPSKYSQPTLGAPMQEDPYKTMHQYGLSEKNPEDSWTIDPFAPKKWGGR